MTSQRENIEFLKKQLKSAEYNIEFFEQALRKNVAERDMLIKIITELQKLDETGG